MSLKEFEKPRTNGQAGNRKAEVGKVLLGNQTIR